MIFIVVEDRRMNDLVNRQAAIDALNGEIEITGRMNAEAVKGYIKLVKDRLERLPSAQSEITRCKDCKYYVIHTFWGRSQGWCERLCDGFDKSLARATEPNDYCSRAEPYKGDMDGKDDIKRNMQVVRDCCRGD